MRLLLPGRMALLTGERMARASTRSRYFKIGVASIIVSIGAAVLYVVFWRREAWLGLGAAIGVLSGAEMMGNAAWFDVSRLKSQNLLFGTLYAAAAVATYLVLLR